MHATAKSYPGAAMREFRKALIAALVALPILLVVAAIYVKVGGGKHPYQCHSGGFRQVVC